MSSLALQSEDAVCLGLAVDVADQILVAEEFNLCVLTCEVVPAILVRERVPLTVEVIKLLAVVVT